jgi:hypothetical protein
MDSLMAASSTCVGRFATILACVLLLAGPVVAQQAELPTPEEIDAALAELERALAETPQAPQPPQTRAAPPTTGEIDTAVPVSGSPRPSTAAMNAVLKSLRAAIAQLDPAAIQDGTVTLGKLENRAAATLVGRASGAGTGPPQEITATQGRTILNVENGATADQTAAEIESAYNAQVTAGVASDITNSVTGIRRWSGSQIKAGLVANPPDINSLLPAQTGNGGKVLGTDGTTLSWVSAGSPQPAAPDDADGDGFKDLEEYLNGTDPWVDNP